MTRGPDLGYVRSWLERYWLGVWFATISGAWLYFSWRSGVFPGSDQYLVATRRWLEGVDPWATEYPGWFAAPPITFLPLLPFAILPFGQVLLVITAAIAAVATIRLLERPWYWLLFPPLVNAVIGGGIDAWLVPLILIGHGWLAVLGKVYAAVPLAILGRWRPLVVAGVIIVVTAPLLPWASYIAQLPEILRHQAAQAANLSAPIYLVPVAVVALLVMGRDRSAWMAVPALWPSTQWYYNSIALPALTPLAAALIAIPSPWFVVAACVVLAIDTRRGRIVRAPTSAVVGHART